MAAKRQVSGRTHVSYSVCLLLDSTYKGTSPFVVWKDTKEPKTGCLGGGLYQQLQYPWFGGERTSLLFSERKPGFQGGARRRWPARAVDRVGTARRTPAGGTREREGEVPGPAPLTSWVHLSVQ